MKNHLPLIVCVTVLSFLGCTKDGADGTGKTSVQIIYPEISLCDKSFVSDDTLVWQNFQIKNVKTTELIISKIELRGNSQCAFKVFREPMTGETGFQLIEEESKKNPFINMSLPYGESTLLRVEYTPSREGLNASSDSKKLSEQYTDHATLVITSNADSNTHGVEIESNIDLRTGDSSEDATPNTRILIPMCGVAILPPPSRGSAETCPELGSGALAQPKCKDPLPTDTPGCPKG